MPLVHRPGRSEERAACEDCGEQRGADGRCGAYRRAAISHDAAIMTSAAGDFTAPSLSAIGNRTRADARERSLRGRMAGRWALKARERKCPRPFGPGARMRTFDEGKEVR